MQASVALLPLYFFPLQRQYEVLVALASSSSFPLPRHHGGTAPALDGEGHGCRWCTSLLLRCSTVFIAAARGGSSCFVHGDTLFYLVHTARSGWGMRLQATPTTPKRVTDSLCGPQHYVQQCIGKHAVDIFITQSLTHHTHTHTHTHTAQSFDKTELASLEKKPDIPPPPPLGCSGTSGTELR